MKSVPEPSHGASQTQRRRERELERPEEENEGIDELSLGERFVPFVFAVMETCWIYAVVVVIAVAGIGGHIPLLPLWGLYVPLAAGVWFAQAQSLQTGQEKAEASLLASTPVRVGIMAVLALLVIWGSGYAGTFPLYAVSWILEALNDILLLKPEGIHTIFVLAVSAFLFWRGVVITSRRVEPGDVMKSLQIGLGVIVLALLLSSSSGGGAGVPLLFLMVVLFLSFALIAHSLAQASFLRVSHTRGLQGSIAGQERSIFSVVGLICLVMIFLGLILVAFVSTAFLAQVQGPLSAIFDVITNIIATIAVILVSPLFWLLNALHLQTGLPTLNQHKLPQQPPTKHHAPPSPSISPYVFTLDAFLILAIVVLLVVLVWFIWRRISQRRGLVTRRHKASRDERESIWSWDLFVRQALLFLRQLWWRFFPRKEEPATGALQVRDEIQGEPAVRTIREIYRALLQWADQRGVRRQQEETPVEFGRRLSTRLADGEQELQVVTDAYLLTRYGGYVPDEYMLGQVQQEWQVFRQKANMVSEE